MCGIAGVIGKVVEKSTLENMVRAIKHRGPDGDGVFQDAAAALVHTRLSILDLSDNGAQPMSLPGENRYVIVFNGEVYNHQDLRKRFLKGIQFKSESDTETLLHLYALLGSEMLQYLRGMFAFVIYDKHTGHAFGARDRMGIKPFLYSTQGGFLLFASELAVFKASNLLNCMPEPKAIRHVMLYGSIQHPLTALSGVFSLAPAHYFKYQDGKFETKAYWEFPTALQTDISFEQAKEQFRKYYEDAISLRMLSDRKIGVFLSSGLDSASILAALKHLGKTDVETFTIGFSGSHQKFTSELDAAKALSDHFGFKNVAKQISVDELHEDVLAFTRGIDQPSIDGFNTYLVSKASKDYLTVALSGLGGDELMLGYPRNVNLFTKHQSALKLPAFWSDRLLKHQLNSNQASKTKARIQKYAGNPENLKLHYWSSRLINRPYYLNNTLFDTELRAGIEEDVEEFYAFDYQNYQGDLFNTLSYYEMRTFMLNQLLRDMDVASMANGIEVRFPLIDHVLVEFLFSLPAQYKFSPQEKSRSNQTGQMSYAKSGVKYLLAEAYKSDWPSGLLSTKKQGFQLPIYEWFQASIGAKLAEDLNTQKFVDLGFRPKALDDLKVSLAQGQYKTNHYLLSMLEATV